jgi:hypothetical protein
LFDFYSKTEYDVSMIYNHRLYLQSFTAKNERSPFPKKEEGIALYSRLVGLLLQCFGIATTLQEQKATYYVNKKSWKKWQTSHPHYLISPLKKMVKGRDTRKIAPSLHRQGLPTPCADQNTKTMPIDPQSPKKFEPFYECAPKKFTEKILHSPHYTKQEKQALVSTAVDIYGTTPEPGVITPQSWVYDVITMRYLTSLSIQYPHFRPISILDRYTYNQFDEESLTFNEIEPGMPVEWPKTPLIYGHALRVNGNHRTVFLIDFSNQTVEYYNSFGDDSSAVKRLTRKLSTKYGVVFTYHNKTKKMILQRDAYQCGVWACKFIEERLKKGRAFNPRECINVDIAHYRTKVFDSLFKYAFYQQVGLLRAQKYEDSLFTSPSLIVPFEVYIKAHAINQESLHYLWGKTGIMPQELKAIYRTFMDQL